MVVKTVLGSTSFSWIGMFSGGRIWILTHHHMAGWWRELRDVAVDMDATLFYSVYSSTVGSKGGLSMSVSGSGVCYNRVPQIQVLPLVSM